MNYKRRKPRTSVKCNICTPHRFGNSVKGLHKKSHILAKTLKSEVSGED